MTIYDVLVTTIDGETITLARYRGKVLLIVNTASRCGFTPQYEGLERLWRRHRERGLVILGFPCNQFARQEPGNDEEIRQFCTLTYQVTFPLFARIEVNGPNTHPLYRILKRLRPGILGIQAIKWNFTKFLVGRDGRVVRRYPPVTPPEELESDILSLLDEPPPRHADDGPTERDEKEGAPPFPDGAP